LKNIGYEDRIPNEIAEVFQQWLKILCDIFPGFTWRGRQIESIGGFTQNYIYYIKTIFQRFWVEFCDNAFSSVIWGMGKQLTKKKKAQLKERLREASFNAYMRIDENLKPKPKTRYRS